MVDYLELTPLACNVMWIGLEFGNSDMAFVKQRVEDGFERCFQEMRLALSDGGGEDGSEKERGGGAA